MRKKLLSIVLVIITSIITNFSFAIGAKDPSVSMDNATIELTLENTQHHKNMECEIVCSATMMPCNACILYTHTANLTEINHPFVLKNLVPHSVEPLYSVDLPHEQKPPIFS